MTRGVSLNVRKNPHTLLLCENDTLKHTYYHALPAETKRESVPTVLLPVLL